MNVRLELLELLACPKCKQAVEISENGETIDCSVCRLCFPIRDGIPIMLLDEAEGLDKD